MCRGMPYLSWKQEADVREQREERGKTKKNIIKKEKRRTTIHAAWRWWLLACVWVNWPFLLGCLFFSSFSFFSLSLGPLGHHFSHIIPWSHSNARPKTPIEFGLIFLGLFLFVVPDQNSHRFIGYNERVQLFVSKRYVCFGRGDRLVISRQWATQVSKDSRS